LGTTIRNYTADSSAAGEHVARRNAGKKVDGERRQAGSDGNKEVRSLLGLGPPERERERKRGAK